MSRSHWLFSFLLQGLQLARYILSPERILPPLICALLVLILWSTVIHVFLIPEFLLPSPKSIVDAMIDDSDYFLEHGLTTLLEASVGFSLAVVLGFMLGTLFALFGLLERMLLPYAIASQEFLDSLKAFAGGAATLHLSLSVVKYFRGQRNNDDILDATIGFVQWDDKAIQWLACSNERLLGWSRWSALFVAVACLAALIGACVLG